jgi:hypothetical protein
MSAAAPRTTLIRRLLVAVAAVCALTGCRLDVVADVVVEADGTGEIVVVAEADAELVDKVPTIADDLVLDDVKAAGWLVDGPTPTPSGGLILTLTHPFEGKDEATNLLRSLGPPFNDPVIGRGQSGDVTTNTVRANLGLRNGFATFADEDLINAVGGVPFAEQFAANDVDPANSMSAILRVTLPGDTVDSETNGERVGDGTLQWAAPVDGSIVEATARTEQAPSDGGAWARPVSIVALVALVAWVGFMSLFVGYVALARRRLNRRNRQRSLPLADRRR